MLPIVTINALLTTRNGSHSERIKISRVIIGGWTGRNKDVLGHHIHELEKIGVQTPKKTPMFYFISVPRITTASVIEVVGNNSSGEVEYILINHRKRVWVGAGSDHTDRLYERIGITLAKQLCDKPIATEFWPLDELEDHWDQIRLRSVVRENGEDIVYQDDSVSSLLSPSDLLDNLKADSIDLTEETLLFGGTCGTIGGVRFSPRFRLELIDPVLDRKIQHTYDVISLPIKG